MFPINVKWNKGSFNIISTTTIMYEASANEENWKNAKNTSKNSWNVKKMAFFIVKVSIIPV